MKVIPILRCLNMEEAIAFYTGILDFELKYSEASSDNWVVDLINGDQNFGLQV
jgi:catechol 2,3-dioxygenase-like lactoylglutathione lyase family enzyme